MSRAPRVVSVQSVSVLEHSDSPLVAVLRTHPPDYSDEEIILYMCVESAQVKEKCYVSISTPVLRRSCALLGLGD